MILLFFKNLFLWVLGLGFIEIFGTFRYSDGAINGMCFIWTFYLIFKNWIECKKFKQLMK
jgi:hypothetical protein